MFVSESDRRSAWVYRNMGLRALYAPHCYEKSDGGTVFVRTEGPRGARGTLRGLVMRVVLVVVEMPVMVVIVASPMGALCSYERRGPEGFLI